MAARYTTAFYPPYAAAPAPIPTSVPRLAAIPPSYPPPIGGFTPRPAPAPVTARQVHFAASAVINQPLPGPYVPRPRMPAAPTIVFGGPRLPNMGGDPNAVFQLASPHQIEFRRRVYRNADVLLQVLKFDDTLANAPIIDAVTMSENPRAEAEKWRAYWRPDWSLREGAFMRDVLQHKLCQHPQITDICLACHRQLRPCRWGRPHSAESAGKDLDGHQG